MKRIKLLGLGLLVSAGVSLGIVGTTQAAWSDNFKSADNVVVKEGDTHRGPLYVSGESIRIEGDVDGDIYCAGSNVTISGVVNGDVLCAAQNFELDNAIIEQDVRVAAQYVMVDGAVGGTVSAFAQEVEVVENAIVARGLNGAGQKFVVDGQVNGQVAVAGQTLEVNGTVDSDVDASLSMVRFGDDAEITGNFNYSAYQELDVADGVVGGEVSYNPSPSGSERREAAAGAGGALAVLVASMLLSALVVALLLPRFVHRASEVLRENSLMTVLIGFAFALGAPIVALFAIVSVVFMPLGFALLAAWLLVSVLSGIFAAYAVGAALLRSVDNIVLRMLGGAVVLLILYLIPLLNVLALFGAWVVGTGMVVATLTRGMGRPSYSVAALAQKPAKKARTTKK